MELQTNISNCVFHLFSWISGRHLNAAWTKVNSCPSNPDSLLGFPISMKCACSYPKHQEPLLTAVFFSFLYLIITMPCQCHFRHFSYFMTSLHLHYHHCIRHMGISWLSYDNFSSGLPMHSSHSDLSKKKNKDDDILCHYVFETIQWLSRARGRRPDS